MNSGVLAYVGDAVFSLYIRNRIALSCDCKSGELTKKTNRYVKATSQSVMLDKIADKLTEVELDVARRARNCYTFSKAKNAGLADYRRATALEAIIGWLYLGNETERLDEIQNMCYEAIK